MEYQYPSSCPTWCVYGNALNTARSMEIRDLESLGP